VPASVSKTCLVRFDNNKYSVAASAVGRPVEIHAYADRIVIRQNGRIVGEHRRAFGRGATVYDLPSISPERCALIHSSQCMNPAASPPVASRYERAFKYRRRPAERLLKLADGPGCGEAAGRHPSHTRVIAGLSGFLALIHVRTRPER